MEYLLRGILIGLLFGLPVGAIGALTVQRTNELGVKAGLLTGLGSSAADFFYACVGVFGLTMISDFFLRFQEVITLSGGILVLLLGFKSLFRSKGVFCVKEKTSGAIKVFLTSFCIGITNPAAILTFMFAFSYFGISEIGGIADGGFLLMGVFCGTYFWWGILTFLTHMVKKRASKFLFQRMNSIFGGILVVFGIFIFLRLFLH